jgi:hypothetical protein
MKINRASRHQLIDTFTNFTRSEAEATAFVELLLAENVTDTKDLSFARWCELLDQARKSYVNHT